jgi:hypothetical protein
MERLNNTLLYNQKGGREGGKEGGREGRKEARKEEGRKEVLNACVSCL